MSCIRYVKKSSFRIHIVLAKESKKFKEKIAKLAISLNVDSEEFLGSSMETICSIDPGLFRVLDELIGSETRGQGQLELLNLMDVAEGDQSFNDLSDQLDHEEV